MRYLIIGNGVAGITAAFAIRARDDHAAITVVSPESDYFYSRTALMYAFLDRMDRRELEPFERKVYDRQRIERIRASVTDLDASAHTVRLSDFQTLLYDRLLLATGSVPRMADWAGLDEIRSGVCHFVSLQDLDACESLARSSRDAVVVGGGLIGVELVECLIHHGLRVTFLVREPWYWPVALGGEEGLMISEHIRSHEVNVRLNEQVAGVIAGQDGSVRAVQTASGAEYPCQMLGITIGVEPAVNWLRSVRTPPELGRGVRVDTSFRTNLPDVYAAGDCAEIPLPDGQNTVEQIWYSAKRQSELAARSMLGDPVHYVPPVFFNSAKFFDIEYTTVGRVNDAPPAARSLYWRHPHRETSVRIVEHDGAVIGFNMLGSRWDHTQLERWILERRPVDYVISRLSQAQFDVEFGRLDLQFVRHAGVAG